MAAAFDQASLAEVFGLANSFIPPVGFSPTVAFNLVASKSPFTSGITGPEPEAAAGPGSCARCLKETPRNCGGCFGAPAYAFDGDLSPKTFYCGAECQLADWSTHKPLCQARQARKQLVRAAMVLKEIMLQLRQMAYPMAIATQKAEDGTTLIVADQLDKPAPKLEPFPEELMKELEKDVLESMLLRTSGVEAMVTLAMIVKDLLDGIAISVIETEVYCKARQDSDMTAIIACLHQGFIHNLYMVTTKQGETWALDITGAQYGWERLLYPWDEYQRELCTSVSHHWKLGFLRDSAEHIGTRQLYMLKPSETHALASALERQIPAWAAAVCAGGKLSSSLKGTNAEFNDKRNRLLELVRTTIETHLETAHGHGGALIGNLSISDKDKGNKPPAPALPPPQRTLYCIKAASGNRGLGMFATTRIARGRRILAELPLFRVPLTVMESREAEPIVAHHVSELTDQQREAFLALCNSQCSRHGEVLAIVRTNMLPMDADATENGVFLEASRINHSCRPNAYYVFNPRLGKLTVHATEEIPEGGEVLISYMNDAGCYEARREAIDRFFAFKCACELCTLSPVRRRQSDRRRTRILRAEERLADPERRINTPVLCLGEARCLLGMLEDEGLAGWRSAWVYEHAMQVAVANGDEARGRAFAKKAGFALTTMEGKDGAGVVAMRRFEERPDSHELFGVTMNWKQAVSRVPKKLCEEEYEAWLWKAKAMLSS